MIDFRIDTFLAVCQYMNYTKAAEALSITQPAVTQHIHYLEEHFGVKLFQFQGKRPVLTEAGQLLRDAATLSERKTVGHHQERQAPSPGSDKDSGRLSAAPGFSRFSVPQSRSRRTYHHGQYKNLAR